MRHDLLHVAVYLLSIHIRSGKVGCELKLALRWWIAVLQRGIVEKRQWTAPDRPPAHLFVDARGAPARCAGVVHPACMSDAFMLQVRCRIICEWASALYGRPAVGSFAEQAPVKG